MASCLLHDIAKGSPNHADLGSDWLKDMDLQKFHKL